MKWRQAIYQTQKFKQTVIRMLKKLNDNYKKLTGKNNNTKKEIETVHKKLREEMKNTTSEIKNTPEEITNKLDEAED